MKIRTDFVTNSSSSSFVLEIKFELIGGDTVSFCANGGSGETGRVNYFNGDAIVKVSPKQLATAKSIKDMISLLTNGVIDNYEPKMKIFKTSNPQENYCGSGTFDAYDFIEEIRAKIKSVDDIESVTITGNEKNYMSYNRTFTYNKVTGEYTGKVDGMPIIEIDGSNGGDLYFSDLDTCDIEGDYHEDFFNYEYYDEYDDDCDDEYDDFADIQGKKFVITGKLNNFDCREDFVEYIESLGGTVVGAISKNVDYLISNDSDSTSSKTKKAKELNIPIISEDEFLGMFGDEEY